MSTADLPRAKLEDFYAKAAQEYLRSLPLERQALERDVALLRARAAQSTPPPGEART